MNAYEGLLEINNDNEKNAVREFTEYIKRMKSLAPDTYKYLLDEGIVFEDNGNFFARPVDNVAVKGDVRYNVPKKDHGFSNQEIDIVIDSTSIYSEAKEELLNAQRRQVGYGMGKYPEALTAESWDIIETLNHDIEETADSLHYKIMLRQKLTKLIKEGVIVE